MSDGWIGMASGALLVGAAVGGAAFTWAGPHQAETTSQAMMVVQSVTQTSGSVSARRLMDGGPTGDEDVYGLVADGYLAAMPENPTIKGRAGLPVVAAAKSEDGQIRDIVQMPLKDDGKLCDEVQRQVSGEPAPQTDVFPLNRAGCIKTSAGSVAYSRF